MVISSRKIKPIGGDIEFDLDSFEQKSCPSLANYFYLNDAYDYQLVSLGRDALKLALSNAEIAEHAEVLVPSYTCMKVVDVLLELNLHCRFYEVDEKLNIVEESLWSAISTNTKAIVFINYFGFSVTDLELFKRIKLKSPQIVTILDFAQSLFSIEQKFLSSKYIDYIATSMRKFLHVSEGSFLISNHKKINRNLIQRKIRKALSKRYLGKMLKSLYLSTGGQDQEAGDLSFKYIYDAEKELDEERAICSPSLFSLSCLERIDFDFVVSMRKRNAAVLYDMIDPKYFLFDRISNVVPIAVPLMVPNRDELRSALMKKDIYLPVHWPLDSRIDPDKFPEAYKVSKNILGLVVDQRYDLEDMRYLSKTLKGLL